LMMVSVASFFFSDSASFFDSPSDVDVGVGEEEAEEEGGLDDEGGLERGGFFGSMAGESRRAPKIRSLGPGSPGAAKEGSGVRSRERTEKKEKRKRKSKRQNPHWGAS
jgi:hypothetical protein